MITRAGHDSQAVGYIFALLIAYIADPGDRFDAAVDVFTGLHDAGLRISEPGPCDEMTS